MARPAIGIVEDDARLRAFLASVVEASDEFDLAFAVATIRDGRQAIKASPVSLCLVDLNLPDGHGVEMIRAVKQDPAAKALVLSVLGDRVTVMEALSAGADGYLLKSGRPEVILDEIRQTLDGLAPVSPQIAAYLLEMARGLDAPAAGSGHAAPDAATLTPRECELLNLFARGLTYREAASALDISVNTVSDHVRNIYSKLSVHSRSEAVFEAQSLGLIAGVRPQKPEG